MSSRLAGALSLLALLAAAAGCGPSAGADVVAVVNGYRITEAELERHYLGQLYDQTEPPSEEQARMMRLNILREIIDRQILLQRADDLGLTAVDAEVEESFQQYRAPFDDEESFLASLTARGLNLEELRAEIRRTLTIEKLFNREITSRVKVSDAEVRGYYEENEATFTLPEQQLHLAQILVTASPESPPPNLLNDDAVDLEQAKTKIGVIEDRLADGDDFAELAENYSEDPVSTANGGDLGFIPQSSLEQADLALRRVVASMSPGDISPVVEIDGAFRIIKLIARENAGKRDFSDPNVQQTIRDTLLNRKDQLLRAAFLEVARNEAQVENHLAKRIVDGYGIGD